MAMTASSRSASAAGAQDGERSPFARLTELLSAYTPGKPLINMSIGEPQHRCRALSDRCWPAISTSSAATRLPRASSRSGQAAAAWISRRFGLAKAIDPETEILVLNGSREGLFFAAIAAARYVGPRKGTPAILMPNPFYPAYAAVRGPPDVKRCFCRPRARTAFCPISIP